jgi:hypothetical protein
VEGGAADANTAAAGEVGGDAGVMGGKGDAGELGAVARLEADAELGEGGAGIGHEAFAARLVDGGLEGVGEENVGAALAQSDSGGEARRTGTDDAYVTVVVTHDR